MMLLQWRRPEPVVVLRWRGAEGAIAAMAAAKPPVPVPTLIGPPGVAGPPGPQGPAADLSAAVLDGGTFS